MDYRAAAIAVVRWTLVMLVAVAITYGLLAVIYTLLGILTG